LRAALSSDNSRTYFNELGNVFVVHTATDKLSSASLEPGCCYGDYELSLASNQLQLTATSYLYDANLNGESYYALNDREVLNVSYVYGAKFSPDGRLLFQPSTNGIDVLDGRLGNLLQRIALPLALSTNYDALVNNGRDNVLIAITGTNGSGIAIIDLGSIPEPAALPYNSSQKLRPVGSDKFQSIVSTTPKRSTGVRLRSVPHVTKPAANEVLGWSRPGKP
jgi:hypothetical protein